MYNDVHRNEPTMNETKRIGNHMMLGEVYRRAVLVQHSDNLDCDLRLLVDAGKVRKLWRGV